MGESLSGKEERGKRALAFQGTSPSEAPAPPACLSVSELCAGGASLASGLRQSSRKKVPRGSDCVSHLLGTVSVRR